MHLADAFIQSDLQCMPAKKIFFGVSMCVPWELNPQTFALLSCSTTEPQEHFDIKHNSFMMLQYLSLALNCCSVFFSIPSTDMYTTLTCDCEGQLFWVELTH